MNKLLLLTEASETSKFVEWCTTNDVAIKTVLGFAAVCLLGVAVYFYASKKRRCR